MPRYRDDVYATLTRRRDLLDRQDPRLVFNFATLARTIPGYLDQFTAIPNEFWAANVTTTGISTAIVACPCGQEPVIEAGLTEQCACGRIFFFSGRGVMVANSPKGSEPVAVPVEDDDPFFPSDSNR